MLLAKLSQIADTGTINHNRLIVDNIYLASWAQDNFELTDEQINELMEIALLSPYSGGDAVYTARVMLNLNPVDEGLDYALPPPRPKQEVKPNTAHIYPNPSRESITIAFDQPITGEGIVEIWSMMGNKLLSERIPKDYVEQIININSLTSGLYLYVIKVNGVKFSSGKLIVIK